MSNYTEINRAIYTHLKDMAQDWRISIPNVTFTPTTNENYLELSFLPAGTSQATLGTTGMNRNTGLAQIMVKVQDGVGFKDADLKADEIAEHFKRGTILENGGVKVHITKVEPNPALVEDDKYNLPVSIYYRADTNN